MNIQVCRDTSDAVALYLPQRLYLKSFAKLNISVQLPSLKVHGKAISNWELMERLRKFILPETFSVLKVTKHSTEVIRFDAELEFRDKLEKVLSRLDGRVVQLSDYPEPLKVRVSEAKSDFPSRHSWDSFYRDATDMDEMKPGERPDTVHIANLPIRWFVSPREQDEDAPPSESIFKKVFEKFGEVRQVDVPVADPFRMQMKAAMRGITTAPPEQALYFEGYVQFSEYVAFVRCMDALRGRKLLKKRDDVAEWCGIKVDFDKTKHMTDAAVKRRAIVRERLATRQRAKDEEGRLEKEKMAKREMKERQKHERVESEKLERMREREERRKKKQLAKLMAKENVNVDGKYAEEERKLLKAQRKLQAVRLIEELFKRIELRPQARNGPSSSKYERYYHTGDSAARERIVAKIKHQHEDLVDKQRDLLKQAKDGRIVIRTALETKKPKPRTSSISSASSEDYTDQKRIKTEKLTTPEREMEFKKAMGAWGGYGFPYPGPPPHYAAPAPPPHLYYPHHNPHPPPHQASMYYPVRGAYYPPPAEYARRGGRARGMRGRGRPPRMPYYDGPDPTHFYYKYFKKLTEAQHRHEHDDRSRSRSRHRSRSRTRSRSRRRSYTRSRSRSRSRRRSYTRSRSRGRRSRSRSRSSRGHRSRSHKSRSRSRDRRSRSHSRRSRSRSRSKPRRKSSPAPETPRDKAEVTNHGGKMASETPRRERSKSWSLPKDGENRKSWSKSPSKGQ